MKKRKVHKRALSGRHNRRKAAPLAWIRPGWHLIQFRVEDEVAEKLDRLAKVDFPSTRHREARRLVYEGLGIKNGEGK